ncbi:MAG: protein kinase [Planctomycetes bacterium]|nr:protein kinase [Planctomycetota bacterium]
MAKSNRLLKKNNRDSFDDAVLALLDGESLEGTRFEESRAGQPRAWNGLRILESIRDLYGGPSPFEAGLLQNNAGGDRLQFKEELGAGAFGRVRRARDLELARDVAIKTVPLANAHAMNLLKEARALAKVEHPGVVRIYRVSKTADAVQVEMQLIEGDGLDRWIGKNGPVAAAEAARVGAEIADALEAIHSEGLIHGDLKPSNVMRRGDGSIVLLDFGLARFIQLDSAAAGIIPRGTPAVMAPEQLEPGETVGPRADLYALSVILYWMVAGRFPHDASTFGELKDRVLRGSPRPIEGADSEFCTIVSRGMSRRPRDRFANAREFAGALRNYLEQRAARTRPLRCDANLFVKRGGDEVRLQSGGEVRIGDRLSLEIASGEEMSVYIFNESRAGEFYLLFPIQGLDLNNPLSAGSHRLPGRRARSAMSWTVNSDGGGEERICIVATRVPIPEVEECIKNARPASETEAILYPRLSPRAEVALMRGIGGLARERETVSSHARGAGRLDAIARGVESANSGGACSGSAWCRILTLKNAAV